MRRPAAVVLGLALLAGCAADLPDDEPVRPLDALAWDSDVDLGDVQLAVGSQDGAESEVLGWIAAEALIAAGADITSDMALGDVQATREAQLSGLIDLYWEHTGTGWVSLLREIGPNPDPRQLYEDVRDEDLEENEIVWLEPAPADVGLGIIAAPDTMADLGVDDLGELGAALDRTEEGIVVCIPGSEQPLDPVGLAALAQAAQVRIRPRVVNPVPAGQLVRQVEEGTFCPFGLVDRLAPALDGADVRFLDDDVGAFVAQNPAVTIRDDTYSDATGVSDVLDPVSERLDTVTLRDLVEQVTSEGDDPRDVARDWLVSEGLASR